MSSDVQRLIRKLQPNGPRSFDEQVWPIYIAIVVLLGYLAGVIVSVLRFDDPRIHANATTWLLVLAVLATLGIFCVRFLEHRLLKRTLVLSLLLSLIVNITMMIGMAWTAIMLKPWQPSEPTVAVREQHEEVVVPEYPLFDTDPRQRVPQEHERPVETGEVQAEQRVELTRQSTMPDMEQTERPPVPNVASQTRQYATTMPKRADVPSAPRQSSTMSKLSRQDLQAQLAVNNSTRLPEASPQSQPTPRTETQLNASPAQASKAELAPQTADTEWTSDLAPQPVEMAALTRRALNDSEALSISSLPTLPRKQQRPLKLPATSTPVDDRMTLSQQTQPDVEPNSTLVHKQNTTSSPEEMTSVDLQRRVAVDLHRQTRMDKPESATLSAHAERAMSARSARLLTDAGSTETDRPDVSTQAPSGQANPTSAQIAKQSNVAVGGQALAEVKSVRDPQPSPSTLARAVAETEASVSNTLAHAHSPLRSSRLANTPTQPNTQVESPISADSNLVNPAPMPQPSRMALSRSSIGVAGVGNAANLERGVAAPESPVSIASASANRPEAQQEQAEAFALSPSSRALSRQMRATENQPRTSMLAQQIESAMVPGTTAPAEAAASSAATLEHAPSNATLASTTGAKGTTEVDLGPTRIAADTGDGRAEGGGQPEINTGELARALPKSNSIAGAAGLKRSTDVPRSPAAQDLASDSDTVGQVAMAWAMASAVDVARAAANLGARLAGGESAEFESDRSGELRELTVTGGARAEDDASITADQIAAGGNTRSGRRARGLQIKTETVSNVPSLAAADSSSGSSRGEPLDAQAARARQSAIGLPIPSSDEIGAAEGKLVLDGTPVGQSEPIFARKTGGRDAVDGELAIADTHRGAPRRSRQAQFTGSATDVELDPEELAMNATGTSFDDRLAAPAVEGIEVVVARQGGGAIAVDVEAEDDLGGLGGELAPDAGILTRRASQESDFVSLQPARFLRRTRSRASISSTTEVVSATKAFRRRVVRRGEELAGERGLPSLKTEASIELGLVFLAKYQSADGSWSFNNFADGKAELPDGEEALIVSDSAATGLALLSFLGAGYHHKEDKYQEHVKNGIDFLIQHQQDDGDLYIDQDANSSRSAWLYSHAITTIALCEAYGMTQDPQLRRPAQKAVNFIEESQHPTRGGWRYSPAYGADTSVTGWMIMALKSGELAGLTVDQKAFERVEHWLELAQASEEQSFLFRYNPYAADTPSQRHGRQPTRAMTAVGLLMRLYTGWSRTNPQMIMGARTLDQNLPNLGTSDSPKRDTYYWYYATQVMFHMGGEQWQRWNQALHPMLTKSQLQAGPLAGSWDPQIPVPDRWGAYGGRLYVTTMNLLSLEVFYRHLPIYEDTAK